MHIIAICLVLEQVGVVKKAAQEVCAKEIDNVSQDHVQMSIVKIRDGNK